MGFEGAKLRQGWYAATAVIVAVYATVVTLAVLSLFNLNGDANPRSTGDAA